MKLDLDVVAKEMRRARFSNGNGLFAATEFLSAQQISSFFFRLAAKARQKEVQVKEVQVKDALAVEEEVNFSTDRDSGFVPSCHSPYCGRSVRLVCLGKKQGIKNLFPVYVWFSGKGGLY